MTFQLTEHQERIIVRLDNIIRLPESNSYSSYSIRSLIIRRYCSILTRPFEVRMSLAAIHILLDIQYDNVVESFHFERDSPSVIRSRSTENKLDLYVMRGFACSRIDSLGMSSVCRSNKMSSFVRCVDGEDSDKDVDGSE